MAYTTSQEICERWMGQGDLPADAVIVTLIDDAEDTILAAVPDLAERLEDGRIPMGRLHKIVSRMIIRHLQNPNGWRQMQETVGPFTRGFTQGGDEPGSVYLTRAERRELLGGREGKAFQIDTTPTHVHRTSVDAERYC